MLQLTIAKGEAWNEINEEFIYVNEHTLQLEHSLLSLSKWESRWHKPFLSKQDKTVEETIDYVRCMNLTPYVDPNVYWFINNEHITRVNQYIEDPMTATWFSNKSSKEVGSKEIVTAEIIYYWMIALNIPFECEQWHLNKLLTLIQVCNIKNSTSDKMSKKETMSRNRALNAARKKQLKTKG